MSLPKENQHLEGIDVLSMLTKPVLFEIELTEDEEVWLDKITSEVTSDGLTPEQSQYKEWARPHNEIEALLFQMTALLKSVGFYEQFCATLNTCNLFPVHCTEQINHVEHLE